MVWFFGLPKIENNDVKIIEETPKFSIRIKGRNKEFGPFKVGEIILISPPAARKLVEEGFAEKMPEDYNTPNKDWDNIVENVLKIFDKNLKNLPQTHLDKTKKDIKKEILELAKDILKNKSKLKKLDCDTTTETLIKLLRPGQTTTLLIESYEQIEKLKEGYNGKKEGPYIIIRLDYVNEKGKHPSFRLFCLKDYNFILEILNYFKSDSSYHKITSEILEKIELAAFCKGGDRRARWRLDKVHSEYGDFNECHKVAAKLIYFFLDVLSQDLENKNLYSNKKESIKKAKEKCLLLFNEKEKSFIEKEYNSANCPMCLNKIKLIDFFRNGRNDPYSITFGHYEFRGDKTKNVHIGKNAFWLHRTCNSIQGEFTIKERIEKLKKIIEKHNLEKINWDNRG